MKGFKWLFPLLAGLLVAGSFSDGAEKKPEEKSKPPITQPQAAKPLVAMPVYKPPTRGAPRGRVGGGSRGLQKSLLGLAVLAPDHTGLTIQEQPDLYWHLAEMTPLPIEFTLIEENAILPVVETRISSPSQPGIQRIQLSAHNARLKLGSEYRWFVAVVADPNSRSKDILAGGFIERIEPSQPLRTRLASEASERAPGIYAEAGIWYDAVATIGEMIGASHESTSLHAQRKTLLEQVELQEIVAYETARQR